MKTLGAIAIVLGGVLALSLFTDTAYAQTPSPSCDFGYFEMPFGGMSGCIDDTAEQGFVGYIGMIVRIFLGVIVSAGIIAVVVGGYLYMTAGGNGSQVEAAKTWIKSALFGIVLALASWLILNTINPQLAGELQEPMCNSNDDCKSPYICKDGLCQDPG